jgi:hypothetical protein
MLDAGCRMPDAGCRMPDAGCRMPRNRNLPLPNSRVFMMNPTFFTCDGSAIQYRVSSLEHRVTFAALRRAPKTRLS